MNTTLDAPEALGQVIRDRPRLWCFSLAFACWLSVSVLGLVGLWDYSTTAGLTRVSADTWPHGSAIARSGSRPTLTLFLHPKCPCSRATVEELSRLLRRCHGLLEVNVVFIRPAGAEAGWARTDLAESARALPGLRVIWDENGREARVFRATTSGEAMLHDRAGNLVFHGGITGARGHIGENPGGSAIESFVREGRATTRSTPVFGCALFADAALRTP